MLKWGKVSEAQILATESALHARSFEVKESLRESFAYIGIDLILKR